MNTPSAPAVGQRVTIEGVQFIVNRVTVQKNSKVYHPGEQGFPESPTRAQIDLMAVEEVERRQAGLAALLEGKPQRFSGFSAKE